MKKTILNKIIILLTVMSLVLTPVNLPVAFAQTEPTPPAASAPTPPPVPETTPPPAPETTPPPAPESAPPPAPGATGTPAATPTPFVFPPRDKDNTPTSTPAPTSPPANTDPATSTTSPNTPSGSDNSGNIGDTTVNSGPADTAGSVVTGANTNSASAASAGQSATIGNSGNGADSTNNSSSATTNSNNINQNNSASVGNTLNLDATSGQNRSNGNVGNTTITTSDANVSGTAVTAVNTNLSGVMVSEFNVNDNQTGDLVLDFSANCIYNCQTQQTSGNTGNGDGSNNNSDVTVNTDNNTFQNNDAAVGNNMVLTADSGNNTADKNTGGDSTINTGDANVSANSLTYANNNIDGAIVYGVVNIYGDLHGDIVFPEEAMSGTCCTSSVTAGNTGNGADSTNTANAASSTNNDLAQSNAAVISNNLTLDANTGDNNASKNTDGDSSVETGKSTVDANVLNIANSNINGGNWWIVIVNEAGKWIGKIMGAPEGSNVAGSQGTEFEFDGDGNIIAQNNANGSGSTNNAGSTQNNDTNVQQANSANVSNNLTLSANTGENSTSKNTGGDNAIKTGDATVIANIVNFLNNNVTGGGKVFVTVVNVFGNWFGDFVAPGQKKTANNSPQATPTPAIGGTNPQVAQVNTPTPTPVEEPEENSANLQQTVAGYIYRRRAVTRQASATTAKTVTGKYAYNYNPEFESLSATDGSVLGSALVNPPQVAGRKVIRINLAWLILALPCVILFLVIKKVAQVIILPRKIFAAP